MNQQIKTRVGLIIILIIAATAGFFIWKAMRVENFISSTPVKIQPGRVCTQEAKQCPDGSYVSRSGPNCEFETCTNNNIVGNDRDEHGCIGSAGYTWCEEKNKCLRNWEEKCESAGEIIYKNTDYGFKVTLPKGWEKFQVSMQRDKEDDKYTYFYFMMPTTDKSWVGSYDKNTGGVIPGMVDIFVITANDLATWNTNLNSKECKENPNPSCPYEGSVIAKNGKYVFDASYGNGLFPSDVQKFRVGNSAFEFLSGKFMFLD